MTKIRILVVATLIVCLGRGVGQGGHKGELAEVDAAKGLPSSSAQMGCGEDFLLVGAKPQDEQRLRGVGGEPGGICLGGDESPYGEASSS